MISLISLIIILISAFFIKFSHLLILIASLIVFWIIFFWILDLCFNLQLMNARDLVLMQFPY